MGVHELEALLKLAEETARRNISAPWPLHAHLPRPIAPSYPPTHIPAGHAQ